MRLGSTWITVTGMDAPSSAKTRVMPHLRPITPILISLSSFQRADYDWPGVKNLVKSTARRDYPTGRREPRIIAKPDTPLQYIRGSFLRDFHPFGLAPPTRREAYPLQGVKNRPGWVSPAGPSRSTSGPDRKSVG